MPKANQQAYLKKGAVFLAIRMKMNAPNATDLTSQPLHVVYKSDELSAPIKFTHDSRTFDLDLYVFSKKPLKTDLTAQYLQRNGSIAYKRSQGSPELDKILGGNIGFVTKFSATELNTPKKSLNGLRKDPSFALSEL